MKIFEFIASETELYELKMKPIAVRYGLTNMELSILLFLANNPEYDTATEIVEIRHLTKSHVSISVRSLEEKCYLKKEYRNGDHRTTHLVLLRSSQEIISTGRKAQSDFMSTLTRNFSKDEIRKLEGFLCRMNENVCKALKKGSENGK
ncbi:MAG: MarR family transcriptional regulator [Treponemataceae bacterium]|nr:MarR family transcriptional regulator [Treponemataceae bacterium]